MNQNSMLNKASKKVTEGTDQLLNQLKSGLQKLGDLGTVTKDKFIDYIKDVFDVLPHIEEAGFKTKRIIIGISIPPSIEIHVFRVKELNSKQIEVLMNKYESQKMFKLILKALLVSNDFQSKISSESMVFSETCIEISIPPRISIKYLDKELASIKKIEQNFD